jgi:hypothetical protein
MFVNQLRGEFPQLVSYNRFVELMSAVVIPLCVYLHTRRGDKLHTRHRSVFNFIVNIVTSVIAYTFQPKKPSIGLSINSYVPMAL